MSLDSNNMNENEFDKESSDIIETNVLKENKSLDDSLRDNLEISNRESKGESKSLGHIPFKSNQFKTNRKKSIIKREVLRNTHSSTVRYVTTKERAKKVSQALYFQKRKQLQSIVLSLEEQKRRALTLENEMEYFRRQIIKNTGKDLGSAMELFGDKYLGGIFIKDKSLDKNQISLQYKKLISELKQYTKGDINKNDQESKIYIKPKIIESIIENIKNLYDDRISTELQKEKLSKDLTLMKNLVQQLQTNPNIIKQNNLKENYTHCNKDFVECDENEIIISDLTISIIQNQIKECQKKFNDLENLIIEQNYDLNSAYMQITSVEKACLKLENYMNNNNLKIENNESHSKLVIEEEKLNLLLNEIEKEKNELILELKTVKSDYQNIQQELTILQKKNLVLKNNLNSSKEIYESNKKFYIKEIKGMENEIQIKICKLDLYKKQVLKQQNIIKILSLEQKDDTRQLNIIKKELECKKYMYKESKFLLEKEIEKLKDRQNHLERERELLLNQIQLWAPKLNR